MKRILTSAFLLAATSTLFAQNEVEQKLAGLVNYSFVNGAKLENFIPEITYGFTERYKKWVFKANPYASSQLSAKDSSSFLPVLMSPGTAGFRFVAGYYLDTNNWKFSLTPLTLNFKAFSSFQDTAITIFQHGFEISAGLQYSNKIALTARIGANWHNLTTNSENNFNTVFGTRATDAYYMNIMLQTQINPDAEKPLYLVFAYNVFLNPKQLGNLPNSRMLSIGIRKDIHLFSEALSVPKDADSSKKKPTAPMLIN
jgi:hypothetical protein